MQRGTRRFIVWLVTVASVAVALIGIPGTEAMPMPKRYATASLLPGTPSAPLTRRAPRRPLSARPVRASRRFRVASADVAYPTGPANGSVSTTRTPTLSVEPAGGAASYRFKVTTKPDAETGTIAADTVVSSPTFTVPDGALRDGVTYFWHVTTLDASGVATAPGWVQSFRVDLRLGSDPTQPFDSVGPVSVNLTNGNLVLGASTASVGSVAGPVGVSLTYNSQAPSAAGLLGTYTLDQNGNHAVDAGETPSVVRRDPSLAFDWGSGPPAPGMTATNVIVKWTGTVAVPTSGTYFFGAVTSDGVRVRVNGSLVLDSWTSHTPGTALYDQAVVLAAGTPVPLSVDWYKGSTPGAVLKLYAKKGATDEALVDPSWLAMDSGPLPRGWSLAPTGGGSLAFVRAEVSDGQAVLFGPDGSTHVFTSTGSGFTPPKDEDGVLAWDSQGRLTLDATDGTTYVFDANGLLVSATSSAASPASHTYAWSTPSGSGLPRLSSITDPVSGRSVTLRYGGDGSCPAGSETDPTHVPAGFDSAAPGGKLCAVVLWDGRITRLWYSNGQLGRIENPGSAVTDLVNDSQGRIVQLRDPLASDVVASGARSGPGTWTAVHYDSSGRVDHVQLGEPTAGAARPGHQYAYTSGTGYVYVDGLTMPLAWARQVSYDSEGRVTSDTDATGRTSTTDWNANGLVWGTTDPAGMRTTYVYDWAGRLTDTYGPAPSAWFSGLGPDGAHAARVPHTTTAHDQGMVGLDALYFPNQTWTGAPAAHTFGLSGVTDGTLHGEFGTTVPVSGLPSAWSGRFTGEILLPATGTYTLAPNAMGPTRIYLDDTKVVDTATSPTGTYANTVAGSRHRLRVEYSTPGGSNQVTSNQVFAYTGSAQTFTVPIGVSAVTVEAWGAEGAFHSPTTAGGKGGYAKATIGVSPGEALQVNVGGTGACGYVDYSSGAWVPAYGGWNGGGLGSRWGCGGGGGTDVRQGGTALSDRKVVGGGGGGSADYNSTFVGGDGGGTSGAAGYGTAGGRGGTDTAGGAGGTNPAGITGGAGSFGAGGDAPWIERSGGGGGGYFGGGGGNGQQLGWPGGGGSGHAAGSDPTLTGGVRSGAGQATFSWTQSASLDLHWTPPGGTDARIPGANLAPRYGLTTRSTDADGRSVGAEFANPELGVATASVSDPAGAHPLRTVTAYEPSGYRRPTSRTLPLGGTTSYGSYGPSETVTVPCPGGAANVNQGGQRKSAAGPSGRTDEWIYDAAGRVVASRVHTDTVWTCASYDLRDRVTGGRDRLSHTSSVNYGLDGTVTSTTVDSAGVSHSTSSTVDLLGRALTYTDELGTTTRVAYDQAGRAAATYRTLAGGSERQVTSATYDAAGRVLTQSDHLSGNPRTTTYGYDAAGRPTSVTRPNHVMTTQTYDDLGRVDHVTNLPDTGQQAQAFTATGAAQTFTVPVGVRAITVAADGAQGGGAFSNSSGGLGGHAQATIPVTPGESLQVNVGTVGACTGTADGGWNGGGHGGGASAPYACGGGGATDLRGGGTGLADRRVVAGGGGGAGHDVIHADFPHPGGTGGGASGGKGSPTLGGNTNGGGATPAAGGAGGVDAGTNGTAGSLGAGGVASYSGVFAGGGGGGLYGGGGGATSSPYADPVGTGGGGGSGFVSGVDTSTVDGSNEGAGKLRLTWDTLPDIIYGYSLGGRVTTRTTDARPVTYAYDTYGRLVTTVDGSTTRSYVYDDNSNRCRVGAGTGCDTANWVYDSADRITKSPYASAYSYDAHGSMTATTGTSGNPSATIGYDAFDHATTIDDGTTTVTETLAPSGRVLRRVVTTNATSAVTEDTSFGYAGGGDSPAYSRPTGGGAVTTHLGELTDVGGTSTWALSNGHGDILGTTDASGAFTAVPQADEFGVGTHPASRLGWLGQQQRPSVGGALGLVRMGVRLYDPRLGRFTSVDPVEGGSANDYDYCAGEPVNCFDLGGTMLTPENKQTSQAELMQALKYLAAHPEVVAFLNGLGAAQAKAKAQPQAQAQASNSRRGPDPSGPGGDGGRRGLPPADGGHRGPPPPPGSPRDYRPPTLKCVAGVTGLVLGGVGVAFATDGVGLAVSGGSFAGGLVGGTSC